MQKSHLVLSDLNKIWIVLCVILNNYIYCTRVFRPELSPIYAEFSSDEDDDLVVVAGDATFSRALQDLVGCKSLSLSSALQSKTMTELTAIEALEWLYAYTANESAPLGTYSGSGEWRARQIAGRTALRSNNDFGPWVDENLSFSAFSCRLARRHCIFLGSNLKKGGRRFCLQRVVLVEKDHNFIDEILAKYRSLRWSCSKFRPDYAVTITKSRGFNSFEASFCELIAESCSIFLLKFSSDQAVKIVFYVHFKKHKF